MQNFTEEEKWTKPLYILLTLVNEGLQEKATMMTDEDVQQMIERMRDEADQAVDLAQSPAETVVV